MSVEQTLHMVGGDGPTSYASNSFRQEKRIHRTKPLLEKAVEDIHSSISPGRLVVADLGCASGTNTFLVTSNIIAAMSKLVTRERSKAPEIQFYLNDLPGNDFNNIFESLDMFRAKIKKEIPEEDVRPIYYIYGAPGSFYGRLFPNSSIHLFHSSSSLHWLSQAPLGLKSDSGESLNGKNIYITRKSPPAVQRLYLEQFSRDFTEFLKWRSEEIVGGGQMVLTFAVRRSSDPTTAEMCFTWGLLAESIDSMVKEGLVEEAKLKAFDLPFYSPSVEEVKSVISSEGSFELVHAQVFDDAPGCSDDDEIVANKFKQNLVDSVKAALPPLLTQQFGESILDDLFARYTKNVAMNLSVANAKVTVLATVLKAK